MRTEYLSEFITVAQCRSVSAAAKQLGMSQPTLSDHMLSLEAELDTVLYERTRPLTLTHEGRLVMKYGAEIMDAERALVEELQVFANGANHLTLAVELSRATVGQTFILQTLGKMKKDNPAFRFELASVSEANAYDQLRNNPDLDAVVVFFTSISQDVNKGVRYVPAAVPVPDPLYVWIDSSHPLSEKPSLTWEDLDGVTVVHSPSKTRISGTSFFEFARQKGCTLRQRTTFFDGYEHFLDYRPDEVLIAPGSVIDNPRFSINPDRVFVPIENSDSSTFIAYLPDRCSPVLEQFLKEIG